jgi:hypothetical protein
MYNGIQIYETVITRFNNKTKRENTTWRENNNLESGCIYNALTTLPVSVKDIPNIFVIEMDIESNIIIGIGMIKNRLCLNPENVYSEKKFNYYTYKSNYRISSRYFEEIFTSEEMKLIKLLENYLFRGFSHLKRGIGYSKLPEKMIFKAGKGIPDQEIPNIYTKLFMTVFKRHYKK